MLIAKMNGLEGGDVVELLLPMSPRVVKGLQHSGLYRERAPGFLISHSKLGEVTDRGMTPIGRSSHSPWNYALAVSGEEMRSLLSRNSYRESAFALAETPLKLQVKARKSIVVASMEWPYVPRPCTAASDEDDQLVLWRCKLRSRLPHSSHPDIVTVF